MDIEAIGLFALTEALLSLTPGPAVLLVVGLSIRKGFRIGFAATLGIVLVNALYFTLSALGIGAAIIASATLFTMIKWAGAAYLIYLGIQMLRPLLQGSALKGKASSALDLNTAVAMGMGKNDAVSSSFLRGFVLQASNPKNIMFFVAILPQFITPGDNIVAQMAILGTVSILLEMPILIIYSIASARSARLMKQRLVDWLEAIGGGALIMMGGALALYRKSQ